MTLTRPIRIALYPLSKIYGRCVSFRKFLYATKLLKQKRLKGSVVSVGNLTVGGTGKTPMVLWLAEKFLADGKRVAILSRGYRGANGTSDEVELLKRRLGERVRFGVGGNRYARGRELETQAPVDIFLLDDGFQHLQLARDVDIVMLDGSRKLNDEWLLPAGTLREPLPACRRADILIVSRKSERSSIEARSRHKFSIFHAQTRLLGFRRFGSNEQARYLSEIGPGPFYAFCGIGNPDAFFADLGRWNVPVVQRRAFPDHHKYSLRDTERLQIEASAATAMGLITTEKDAQNLPVSAVRMPIWIAVIEFVFHAESELIAAIKQTLQTRRGVLA
jgi:tetraacyldisaccharide 4'-kinase